MNKIRILAALSLILLTGLTACGGFSFSKDIETKEEKFTDFTGVDLSGSFTAEVIQASSFSVVVTAPKDLFDYIAVSQEGQTLKIYLNPRHPFTDFTTITKVFKARVTLPVLKELCVSGTARVTAAGFKSAEPFNMVQSGASYLNLVKLEAGDSSFNVSGASECGGEIKVSSMKFDVSGASKVNLTGSATNTVMILSGASRLNVAKLMVTAANANLSGASEADVNVKDKLDVVLSGASKLYFKGNPAMGTVNIADASTLKHQ